MKRILLIGTGGTIAAGKTAEGLMPELTSEQLLSFVPAVSALCRAECLQLLSLDSTNLAPSHWLLIAKAIRERYDRYDGFVISHGTDTMAYTAAALSYLIQGARKPIILTGAQKPISFDSTDSKGNLTDAFLCACSDTLHGVMIVFNGKVIQGTRACKTRTKSYEAFSSINYPYLAVLQDGCILQYIENACLPEPVFYDTLDERVALLKLIPGARAELAGWMLRHNDALILESFGVGGIPSYDGNDFLSVLEEGIQGGKTVVLTTQVQNEGSNVGVYQVGHKIRECPQVLEAFDMTLSRLGLRYLDLYLIHWPNPIQYRTTWQEATIGTWKAFEELYKAGRIRAIGVSNFMPHHIELLKEHCEILPMVNQLRLCPGVTQPEVVAYCKKNNILVEAYSPFGTGAIFKVPQMQQLAQKYGRSVGQICLRWSMQMGWLPLPKSANPDRVKENLNVFDFELEPEDVELIASLKGVCGEAPVPDEIHI